MFRIVQIPISSPTLWPNTTTNCYLVGNEQESILIDAAYDQEETKMALEQAIQEHQFAVPKKIILTHGHQDHAPGVKQLSHWDPVVICHEEEWDVIEVMVNPIQNISTVKDNETITVAGKEINLLHTPGHTKGHLSLYIPSLETLIGGDNVLSEGTTWIGPPDGDMSDYLNTLNRLQALSLKKIGPGHGEWIYNPYEKISFVINRRLQREKQILSILTKENALTVEQITDYIYRDSIHPSVIGVAQRTMEAHLLKLIKDGKVKSVSDQYMLV